MLFMAAQAWNKQPPPGRAIPKRVHYKQFLKNRTNKNHTPSYGHQMTPDHLQSRQSAKEQTCEGQAMEEGAHQTDKHPTACNTGRAVVRLGMCFCTNHKKIQTNQPCSPNPTNNSHGMIKYHNPVPSPSPKAYGHVRAHPGTK